MGLFSIATAFGAGYVLGRPGGRAGVTACLDQARQWATRPEVKRLRERGWDLAGAQVAAAKRQLDARRGATASTAPSDPAARDARRQLSGRRRRHTVAPTVTGAPAEVGPNVDATPTDRASGFGGTTVAQDSRAVILGGGVLPPTPSPGTAGPTSPPS